MSLQEINKLLDLIKSLKEPARLEAAELFPDHPKAQEIWVKLCCGGGGIKPVVDTLGLHDEFDAYSEAFFKSVEQGHTKTASLQVSDFRNYCKRQLLENFYLFK